MRRICDFYCCANPGKIYRVLVARMIRGRDGLFDQQLYAAAEVVKCGRNMMKGCTDKKTNASGHNHRISYPVQSSFHLACFPSIINSSYNQPTNDSFPMTTMRLSWTVGDGSPFHSSSQQRRLVHVHVTCGMGFPRSCVLPGDGR